MEAIDPEAEPAGTVLIETYWNVNRCNRPDVLLADIVLIETYWNVNSFTPRFARISMLVLIETYWNVNTTRAGTCPGRRRINRNILECKSFCDQELNKLAHRINRNILECKFRKVISFPTAASDVLIETYWNVNLVSYPDPYFLYQY